MEIFYGFSNKNELDTALSRAIVQDIKSSIEKKGKVFLLFSGGSTPKGLFQKLAQEKIDWQFVTIGLVDERMVGEESEFSNAAMLKKLLINAIPGENKPTFLALAYYANDKDANLIKAIENLNKIGIPDAVVLGMGNDGHFASLFPGDSASELGLSPVNNVDLLYTKAPQFPHSRISHSWSYLRKSKRIYLHITGNDKKDLIRKQHKGNLPIDTVLNDKSVNLEIYWSK
jgi:6-phosphogluconolactonase